MPLEQPAIECVPRRKRGLRMFVDELVADSDRGDVETPVGEPTDRLVKIDDEIGAEFPDLVFDEMQ